MATKRPESLKALVALHKNPVLFVTHLLKAEPEPFQREFLEAVANNPRVAVRSAAGVGKTTTLAWLILWFLLTRFPIKIVVTAPSASQLDSALWPELITWRNRLPPDFADQVEIISDHARLVAAPSESFAIARTATKDRPEALQGIHSENVVFIVDEASGVDEGVFAAASGVLSSPKAKIIMASNPTRLSGYFFDAFHVVPHLWKLLHVSYMDSKFARDGTLADEVRSKHGENSYEWYVRVLGEFPPADVFALIPRELARAAIDRNVETTAAPIIWAADIARHGNDKCALAKRQGNTLLNAIRTWGNMNTMQTAAIIKEEWDKAPKAKRPHKIYIDEIGIGAGVVDRLQEDGLPVEGCNVAESPAVKERYVSLRDELWYRMKEWFEKRNCKIPKDEALLEELTGVTYEYTQKSKIKIESKSDFKKRNSGRSSDRADALMMTFMDTTEGLIQERKFMKELKIDTSWVV